MSGVMNHEQGRKVMSKTRMSTEELLRRVDEMRAGWNVRAVMGQHTRLRWVARRTVLERDAETGDSTESQQYESWADAEDLLVALERRNAALDQDNRREALNA